MATVEFSPSLIELERSAWEGIQAGTLTVEAARAVQEAVVAFAEQAGVPRYDVGMGLKRAVRHTAQ
ncbi:hypothetical protein [Streptomyces sp. NBC_00328]|uniref:hypothetical protein n=1 Tax=Streptomyces sp. NBC_00328 TaxID=2903646 RepID=UPI002E2B5734|nr:hypothetical protein [Streptomyces sp. NBC_00328]